MVYLVGSYGIQVNGMRLKHMDDVVLRVVMCSAFSIPGTTSLVNVARELTNTSTVLVCVKPGYQGILLCATRAGGRSMSLGLCPTKLPVAWEERTDHPLVPATGQAPVLTRLGKPGHSAGKIRARVFAYNICTSDGCD